MYVVMPFNHPAIEQLVDALRVYWGQRGVAVHAMDFKQTAKEAALAAHHHLKGYLLEEDQTENPHYSLVEAIITHIYLKAGHGYWSKVLKKRAEKETAAWRKNDLNFIIIVHNLWPDEYSEGFKNVVGKHFVAPILSRSAAPGWATLPESDKWDESDLTEAVKTIATAFKEKQEAGFTEEGS